MIILSIFVERLNELMLENNIKSFALSEKIGCARSTITKYLLGHDMPSLATAIAICDYFSCPLDFLFGRTEFYEKKSYLSCPPFKERFAFLLKYFNTTKYRLQKKSGIPESAIYNWQRGDSVPSSESIVRLADTFDCSVDFVIGREK